MDQKCDVAATSFLEASSHLQECRAVVSNGRRFNTRVNGYTLVDIFDKFFAAQCLGKYRQITKTLRYYSYIFLLQCMKD